MSMKISPSITPYLQVQVQKEGFAIETITQYFRNILTKDCRTEQGHE